MLAFFYTVELALIKNIMFCSIKMKFLDFRRSHKLNLTQEDNFQNTTVSYARSQKAGQPSSKYGSSSSSVFHKQKNSITLIFPEVKHFMFCSIKMKFLDFRRSHKLNLIQEDNFQNTTVSYAKCQKAGQPGSKCGPSSSSVFHKQKLNWFYLS